MPEDLIRTVTQFLDRVKEEDEVTVKFTKKDGTIRLMKCTLNFDKIPKRDHPKGVNLSKILKLMNQHGIIHVYDLEKYAWRSVPFGEVEWVETPKRRRFYRVKK